VIISTFYRKRSMIGPWRRVPGTCDFKMPGGKVCGAPFVGPPNRRKCGAHSPTIQYSGRSSADRAEDYRA
jgi:hypothetical protein